MEERRGVTALFADMQGFTAASEKADPEVVAEITDLCFGRPGKDIEHYGGTVHKIMVLSDACDRYFYSLPVRMHATIKGFLIGAKTFA